MSITISPGTTSVSVDVQILDDDGLPVTGLVAATFPAVSYSKGTNAAAVSITLSDLALITTAHPNDNTAGGVKERSGGVYRLDLPNNAVSSACVLTLIGETTDKRLVHPRIVVRDAKLASDGLNSVTLPSGIITAASIAADALDGKGDWLVLADLPDNFAMLVIDGDGEVVASNAGSGGATPEDIWTYATRTLTSGSGTGARTVTVTVNDGAAVLENALVRFTEGANTYTASTDASGQASFSLDDATYTVAITKSGYSFTPTTLAVDGNETPTYSMTAITITPGTAPLCTGYATCLGEDGQPEAGVHYHVQTVRGRGTDGFALDGAVRTEISNGSGYVEFEGLVRGTRIACWRGDTGKVRYLEVPDAATVTLEEVIGDSEGT